MRINNKGFLLAETIVTVCIIATLATSMYLYVSTTTSRFEERSSYENVVDVYKANTLKKYLKNKNGYTAGSSADYIPDPILGDLKDKLDIKEAYIMNNSHKSTLIGRTDSQALKDYLNWVPDYSGLKLIVWFNGNDKTGTFVNLNF